MMRPWMSVLKILSTAMRALTILGRYEVRKLDMFFDLLT